MVTIDELAGLLPESTTLRGLHDSGNYVDLQPFVSDYTSFIDQCRLAFDLYGEPSVNGIKSD